MESKDTGTNTSKRPESQTLKAARYVKAADSILVFTGAGISAESGIPTFREAQSGLWAIYNPQELASPEGFDQDPYQVLSWYLWRLKLIQNSEPNPGHHALVALEEYCLSSGKDFILITQNIDGLHIKAGSSQVLELHGNIFRLRCHSCSLPSNLNLSNHDLDQNLPRCTSCSGLLRPDVVWFGEGLPEENLDIAWEKAASCDLFFCIGTSTLVQPAASLPFLAVDKGATMIEINPETTPVSKVAQMHVPNLSGKFLPEMIKAIESQQV